jgi:hypothetical protein
VGNPQLMMSILSQSITNEWIGLLTIPVAIASMGFLVWLLSSPNRQALSPEEAQKIDETASAASVQVESSRARAMELLAEKLPQTEGLPELIRELETIAARLTPTLESRRRIRRSEGRMLPQWSGASSWPPRSE